MNTHIDKLSLNEKNFNDLNRIKIYTNIKYNNVICRWALIVSLLNKSEPPPIDHSKFQKDIPSIEWKTFAGKYDTIYFSLLKERLNDNKIDFTKDNFENELSKHVTRGLMAIAANKNILNYNKNNKDISGNQIRNSYILFKSYFRKAN